MSTPLRFVMLALAFGVALLAEVACKTAKPDACTVDTDCPQGSFCRAGLCASVATDAGVVTDSEPACGTAQNPCAGEDSGAGTSGSTCKDVYGLCSSDSECCAGLACMNAVCR